MNSVPKPPEPLDRQRPGDDSAVQDMEFVTFAPTRRGIG